MPEDPNTLFDEAKCFRCNSDASLSDLLKLGLWQRLAGLTDVDSIVDYFVERSGISDQVEIDAVSRLVTSARVHGWWNKCDLIYPFVGGTAGAHAQNLKSSSFTITWNGTVTHDADGITGDGLTGFGNTGYIPSTSGQVALNSASFSFYRRTLGAAGGAYLNARGSSINHQLGATVGAGNITLRTNNAGQAIASTFLGFVGASRIVSTEAIYHVGGLTVSASNSNTVPPVSIYILANNQNGVTNSFSTANVSGATAGSGLTEAMLSSMASDWQTFQTALGRQV